MDDASGATDIPLQNRVDRANKLNASLYVSFHHNALNSKWGSHGGTETFKVAKTKSASIKKIENNIAGRIHSAQMSAYKLRDRRVQTTSGMYVLSNTKMPAILVEGGFMDSRTDIGKLRSQQVLKQAGINIAKAIVEYNGGKFKSVNIPNKYDISPGATLTINGNSSSSNGSPGTLGNVLSAMTDELGGLIGSAVQAVRERSQRRIKEFIPRKDGNKKNRLLTTENEQRRLQFANMMANENQIEFLKDFIYPGYEKETPEVEGMMADFPGDGNSGELDWNVKMSINESKITQAVRNYIPTIEKFAKQKGVSQYVPLLVALMMVESGGRGGDPMQSSESLGKPPNWIKDPIKSIEVGVGHFKNSLEIGKKYGNDLKTVIQGYNYGHVGYNKYIAKNGNRHTTDLAHNYSRDVVAPSVTKKKAVKISYVNAVSKADGRTYRWRSGGNFHYVNMFLTYVNIQDGGSGGGGSINATGKAREILMVAQSMANKPSRYRLGGGRTQRERDAGIYDCSSFVEEVYYRCGIQLPNSRGAVTTKTIINSNKFVKVATKDLRPGDLTFYHTVGKYGHVGIYAGNGKAYACNTTKGIELFSHSIPFWKKTLAVDHRRLK